MSRITIGTISHNPDAFATCLEPSINSLLNKEFDFIKVSDELCPASNYNNIINQSPNDIIVLLHEDVIFAPQLIDLIWMTIEKHPNFGILGIEGAINSKDFGLLSYEWANLHESKVLTTIDACLAVINKNHHLRFDDVLFDNFHGYVEDYSTQVNRNLQLECRTIYINCYPSFWQHNDRDNFAMHKSYTCQQLGQCWGRFVEYIGKLDKKWNSQ